MAFLNDSVAQSPPPTVISPSRAASNSQVDLVIHPRKTFNFVHTITPPQEKITPLQQTVVLNQADDVRRYLQERLAGQHLRFPDRPREYTLSVSSFYELLEDPDFESDRYRLRLKISYDRRTLILTLSPMPYKRHSKIIEWLNDVAREKLDSSVRRKLSVERASDMVIGWIGFQGEWELSKREPDLVIGWIKDVGGTELHTVVEVGVSQSHQRLLDLRDMYLKGTRQFRRFVFVNVTTDPEYTSPKDLDINELRNIDVADFRLDSDQGPLWYKGVQWVGKSRLSWEAWERDAENGEPTQIFSATIDPNNSETRLPFFEIPPRIATDIEAVTIAPADIQDLWCYWWKHAIIDEAVQRMETYVMNVNQSRKRAADSAEERAEEAKKRQDATDARDER